MQNNSEPVQLVSSNQRRSGNQRQVHRVRISSVVEDIETKQYIRLGSDSKISSNNNNTNNHSDNEDENDDDQSSDENKKAYELTKPIKNLNYNDFDDDNDNNNNNEAAAPLPPPFVKTPAVLSHQPKIISQSYKIMPKQQQQQQLENKQIGFEEEKIVNSSNNPITNLDARERRRQRLRLSQNESKY